MVPPVRENPGILDAMVNGLPESRPKRLEEFTFGDRLGFFLAHPALVARAIADLLGEDPAADAVADEILTDYREEAERWINL